MSPFRAGLYFDQNCPIWQRRTAGGRRKVPPVIPLSASRERDAGAAGRHPALSQAKCLNVTYDNKRFSDVIG